jgi:chromatin remodeling complex protein RSC6
MNAIVNNISNEVNNDANEDSNHIDTQFISLLSTLSQLKTQITSFAIQLRTLEKTVKKEVKQHRKEITKKQSKGSRKPSGFAEAAPISKDLCEFLGKDYGSSVARTDVTKFICNYIRQNSLTNDDNKRVIKPDNKLKSLLGTDDDTVVTYFNIQRFMNKHFIKKTDENTK